MTEIGHGFTVATNAILEGKGEKTALVTTAGFRDVLELGRIRTPRLYDLYYRKPPPLVERRLRFEVRERVSYEGEVLQPLDLSDVEAVADRLAEEGVRSVAVSLLHSYANPDHEARIAEMLMERLPGLDLSLSSQVLPEMREYERTSTTVINAYVRPVVARYLNDLDRRLRARGLTIPLTIMQSNGGLAPVDVTVDRPIFCIESGPGGRGRRGVSPRRKDRRSRHHQLRHGRNDGQGVDHRGRRDAARARVRSGRRHERRPPPPDGRWVRAAGSRHRPG